MVKGLQTMWTWWPWFIHILQEEEHHLSHSFTEVAKLGNLPKPHTSGILVFNKTTKAIKILQDLIMGGVLGVVAMPEVGSGTENEPPN